jgi:hypothetical protein
MVDSTSRAALDWFAPYASFEKKWEGQQIVEAKKSESVRVYRWAANAYAEPKYEQIAQAAGAQPLLVLTGKGRKTHAAGDLLLLDGFLHDVRVTNMSTLTVPAPKKINLRRPDIMEAVQAQVLSHYQSELVDRIRAKGHVLSADGLLTIKALKIEARRQ